MVISSTEKPAKIRLDLIVHFDRNFKCIPKLQASKIRGNKAGYNRMLSKKFPFRSAIKADCKPQPGHSIW